MIFLATIKDIAQTAGVSVSTVSNVLNNKTKRVSAKTIKKINKIMQDMAYTPNMHARSLGSSKSKLIAFVDASFNRSELNNLFRAQLINSIEAELNRLGYSLIIKTLLSLSDFDTFLKTWDIGGILYNLPLETNFGEFLNSTSTPTCLLDYSKSTIPLSFVGINDYKASVEAVEFLYQKGHRRIAYATPGTKGSLVNFERSRGYLDTVKRLKLTECEGLYFETEDDDFIELSKQIAASNATALFTQSDALALALMSGIRSVGKRIPEDISIIGFDNLYIDELLYPPLTTVENDARERGRVAAKTLISMIEGETESVQTIYLPTKIIERSSVLDISEHN